LPIADWSAATLQVPTSLAVTILPATVHIDVVKLLYVTARPEVLLPLALNELVSPTLRALGELLKPVIVWMALTVNVKLVDPVCVEAPAFLADKVMLYMPGVVKFAGTLPLTTPAVMVTPAGKLVALYVVVFTR
jgi:hypothetical protein